MSFSLHLFDEYRPFGITHTHTIYSYTMKLRPTLHLVISSTLYLDGSLIFNHMHKAFIQNKNLTMLMYFAKSANKVETLPLYCSLFPVCMQNTASKSDFACCSLRLPISGVRHSILMYQESFCLSNEAC